MHKTIYKKVHFKMKTRTSFDILNAPGVWCYETNIPDDSHETSYGSVIAFYIKYQQVFSISSISRSFLSTDGFSYQVVFMSLTETQLHMFSIFIGILRVLFYDIAQNKLHIYLKWIVHPQIKIPSHHQVVQTLYELWTRYFMLWRYAFNLFSTFFWSLKAPVSIYHNHTEKCNVHSDDHFSLCISQMKVTWV